MRVIHQEIARYERSKGGMKYKVFDDLRSTVSDFGYTLLQISYYNLDEIKSELSSALREIARPLHIIELLHELRGNDSEEAFIKEAKDGIAKIKSLLEGVI